MIAEIGHYALILALVMALVQAAAAPLGARLRDGGLMALARPAAVAQFVFISAALACLMQAFVVSDFSVVTVADNSHSAKPLLYKFTGTWGNHEGSMLLWIWILAVYGAAVATFGRNLPPAFRAWVLGVQALIGLGFLVFVLATSNPFLRLDPAPFDGRDLNPLLQDPGLAFHPPLLYLGYVGLSTAFSFAVAALIEGRVNAAWARWVRPWTLLSWCALTAGIALGSWWAYYELGWGGYWFWDPVENASFMPWLMATALLHSSIVAEKRDSLKSWTVLLAILGFSVEPAGDFPGALRRAHLGAQLRLGPRAWCLYPGVSSDRCRRLAHALCLARAGDAGRRLVPPAFARGLAADQQPAACRRLRHGLHRHALSVGSGCGRRPEGLRWPSILRNDLRAHHDSASSDDGGWAVDGLEARRPQRCPSAPRGLACCRHRGGGGGRGIRWRAVGRGARHGACRLGGGGVLTELAERVRLFRVPLLESARRAVGLRAQPGQ